MWEYWMLTSWTEYPVELILEKAIKEVIIENGLYDRNPNSNKQYCVNLWSYSH